MVANETESLEDTHMKLAKLVGVLTLPILLAVSGGAVAGDHGTAAEAKAMLDKAVAAVKADKAAALAQISKGEGGFKDRDLYPFCGGPDGNFTAHPKLIGQSMRGLMDKANPSFAVGEALYKAGDAGGGEVKYMWPMPTGGDPIAKIALVAKAGDQICAVGYYP
ncbi:Chemotaxis protein [Azospirillaceae bacterium]